MAQPVKVLPTKPDNLSWMPGTHMVEGDWTLMSTCTLWRRWADVSLRQQTHGYIDAMHNGVSTKKKSGMLGFGPNKSH